MSNKKKWEYRRIYRPVTLCHYEFTNGEDIFLIACSNPDVVLAKLDSATARVEELEARVEQLERAIKASPGTLGYGDLQTEPETIFKVRTILDSALLTPPQNTKGDDHR